MTDTIDLFSSLSILHNNNNNITSSPSSHHITSHHHITTSSSHHITTHPSGAGGTLQVNRPDLCPEGMGIGGLDTQFADIFRRAFLFRLYPPELIKQLGQKNVKGV